MPCPYSDCKVKYKSDIRAINFIPHDDDGIKESDWNDGGDFI